METLVHPSGVDDETLRSYILHEKGFEAQTSRETLTLGDATYKAYRKYIRHVRRHGSSTWGSAPHPSTTPDESDAPELAYSVTSSEFALHRQLSTVSSLSSRPSQPPGTPLPHSNLSFSGMHCILDQSREPCTVLAFSRREASLLAFGNTAGQVFTARVRQIEPQVKKMEPALLGAVVCIDWSLDNTCLMACGAEGTVRLWDTASGSRLRDVVPTSLATCACFFQLDWSVLLVGTLEGEICMYNARIGAVELKSAGQGLAAHRQGVVASMPTSSGNDLHQYTPPDGSWLAGQLMGSSSVPGVTRGQSKVEVVVSGTSHVFTADGGGHVHAYRVEFREHVVHSLAWCSKAAASAQGRLGGPKPVTHLQYAPYTNTCAGPTLLACTWDSRLTIFSFNAQRLEARRIVQLAALSRRLYPCICPPMPHQREVVCLGWEDTSVHFLEINPLKSVVRGRMGVTGQAVEVNTLQGHLQPVVTVGWNVDDNLLASADSGGVVIVWKRGAPAGSRPAVPA